LGNQIIRNLAVSFIAEKNDLYVDYSCYDKITNLGIPLFIGSKKHNETKVVNDENFIETLSKNSLDCNLYPNDSYFQTKEIINIIYNYLHKEEIKKNIIEKNPFKDRYNKNNDLLIHIRLTDVSHYNPGINYYLETIDNIHFDNMYIATDEPTHDIIQNIITRHPNAKIIDYDETRTIQFSSTCKSVILSNGTFSAIIGYLSFFSTVYYPKYKKMWHGDIFSIPSWNEKDY
jgi:hypothetical protein